MRRATLLAAVAVLALAGCASPAGGPDGFDDGELGSLAGYAADDELSIDAGDGLDEGELEALKYRTMARIELLRGLEFEEDVDLELIDRETYRERRGGSDDPAHPFVNEVWRGAFVVDGEADVDAALEALYADAVVGYYSDGDVVIVSDDPTAVRIDRTTLVHELVHALQHQRFGLERGATTIDGRQAENGLIEGEAAYVPHRYADRCGTEWSCVPVSERESGDDEEGGGGGLEERSFNAGLFLSVYAPYAEGPTFITDRVERGGWDAVDAAHDQRPESTSQLIHPERYPDRGPVDVSVTDRSSDEWAPFVDDDGERRTETVGEATLFASLWYNGVVERELADGATNLSPYNYSHGATAGWAGDSFVGYRDATAGGGAAVDDDESGVGHVWKLAWESEGDAAAFRDAYVRILENRGAEPVGDALDVYSVPDGERFAGTYRVSLEGDRVVIVGAPTPADLEAIRPAAGTGEESPEAVSSPPLETAPPETPRPRADASTARLPADG